MIFTTLILLLGMALLTFQKPRSGYSDNLIIKELDAISTHSIEQFESLAQQTIKIVNENLSVFQKNVSNQIASQNRYSEKIDSSIQNIADIFNATVLQTKN